MQANQDEFHYMHTAKTQWPEQFALPSTQFNPYPSIVHRPRLTATVWDDQNTLCYQVDTQGVCVARRQDNDMVNGTKLLNVAGLSRGKRDGILKNEKKRVVVKIGAMSLKGVWIPLDRAKALASQFGILDILYPLFESSPASYICPSHLRQLQSSHLRLEEASMIDHIEGPTEDSIYSPERYSHLVRYQSYNA